MGDSRRGRANRQRCARVVVDIARQDARTRLLTYRDRHADRARHLDVHDPHIGVPDEDAGAQRRRGITNDAEADELCTCDSGRNDCGIRFRRGSGQANRRSSRHPTDEADVVFELQRLAVFTRLYDHNETGLSLLQGVANRFPGVHDHGAVAEERQRDLATLHERPVRLQAKHGRRDDGQKHEHCKAESLLCPRSARRRGGLLG